MVVRDDMSRSDLARYFADQGCTVGAEIGVWKGGFAEKLCQANPKLHLWCVDPWAPQPGYLEGKNDAGRLTAAYQEATSRLKPYRCTFIREASPRASERIPDRSLDFVYIDGNHLQKAVWADLVAWTPKLRSGGFMSGHDYKVDPKRNIEVKPAVDAFVKAYRIPEWFIVTRDKTPSFCWRVP